MLKIFNKRKIITFVASKEAAGDKINPETMDRFDNQKWPWLSLSIPLLHKFGYQTEIIDWQDQSVNWRDKNFVVMGPVWGYCKHQQQFESWLNSMAEMNVIMKNSVRFLLWNFKKTYLQDLNQIGILVPKTIIIESMSLKSLPDASIKIFNDWGVKDFVIKGVVGSSGFGYRHVKKNEIGSELEQHFNSLKVLNGGVVIQEFLPEVTQKGEWSFVFFGQNLSHFFLKIPTIGCELVQKHHGGKSFHINDHNDFTIKQSIKFISEFRPDIILPVEEVLFAKEQAIIINRQIIPLLSEKDIDHPLYMRIDGVMVKDKFLIMEIEGIEPDMEMYEAMQMNPRNDCVHKYISTIDSSYTEKKRGRMFK